MGSLGYEIWKKSHHLVLVGYDQNAKQFFCFDRVTVKKKISALPLNLWARLSPIGMARDLIKSFDRRSKEWISLKLLGQVQIDRVKVTRYVIWVEMSASDQIEAWLAMKSELGYLTIDGGKFPDNWSDEERVLAKQEIYKHKLHAPIELTSADLFAR